MKYSIFFCSTIFICNLFCAEQTSPTPRLRVLSHLESSELRRTIISAMLKTFAIDTNTGELVVNLGYFEDVILATKPFGPFILNTQEFKEAIDTNNFDTHSITTLFKMIGQAKAAKK